MCIFIYIYIHRNTALCALELHHENYAALCIGERRSRKDCQAKRVPIDGMNLTPPHSRLLRQVWSASVVSIYWYVFGSSWRKQVAATQSNHSCHSSVTAVVGGWWLARMLTLMAKGQHSLDQHTTNGGNTCGRRL